MIDTVVITDRDDDKEIVTISGPNTVRHQLEVRPGMLSAGLPALLDATLTSCVGVDVATLVIPSTFQTHLDQLEPATGWKITGLEADTGWYQIHIYTRPQGPQRVHLCVLDRLDPGRNILFAPGWPADRIARHLRAYRDLLDVPWFGTAGLSGIDLVHQVAHRQTNRSPRPLWLLPPDYGGDPPDLPGPVDLRWRSDPDQRHNYGHRWDIRSQYLAAAQAAQLGTDVPERTGPVEFDSTRAGWWFVTPVVDQVDWHDQGGPPLWERRHQRPDGSVWLTTPVVSYLISTGGKVVIHETFTCPPRSRRYLRGWSEIIRDAVYTLMGDGRYPAEVVQAVKGTYRETIGLMNRPGGRLYRPDWRAIIIDLARVLLYSKIHRVWEVTTAWPIRVEVDSVWYRSETVADYQRRTGRAFGDLLGEGMYIGNFRYEGYNENDQGETAS